jgi:two-component system osmolarity sensor histidine kinase EnvZ
LDVRITPLTETIISDFASLQSPKEAAGAAEATQKASGLTLFWRTFFLIAVLLMGSILAWLQTLRSLEPAPRATQTAQHLATVVNLSRAAVINADAIGRVLLLKTMADEEGLRILPREPGDRIAPVDADAATREMELELRKRLGPATVVASRVNDRPGLWIGFEIDGDQYWMLADLERYNVVAGKTWMVWLGAAAVLSLVGAALIAGLINRPLRDLSFAASRVRDGDFNASRLDETVNTSEIREVNIGFNRMAQKLAKLDQDRAVMLAGISHDLRTPLARLRLETEMSVADPDARDHMAADIAQLDAIIGKFLDYARPDKVQLSPVLLRDIVDACTYAFRDQPDVRIQVQIEDNIAVLADEVELGRIFSNLLENARKYGKSVDTGIARIELTAVGRDNSVLIKVRDHGLGVAASQIANLTKPFYRGEAARTAANGAGLGLSIVEKTIQRMGGSFLLSNSRTGGLSANIKLQRATQVGTQSV